MDVLLALIALLFDRFWISSGVRTTLLAALLNLCGCASFHVLRYAFADEDEDMALCLILCSLLLFVAHSLRVGIS